MKLSRVVLIQLLQQSVDLVLVGGWGGVFANLLGNIGGDLCVAILVSLYPLINPLFGMLIKTQGGGTLFQFMIVFINEVQRMILLINIIPKPSLRFANKFIYKFKAPSFFFISPKGGGASPIFNR